MTAESFFERKSSILPEAKNIALKQQYVKTGKNVHLFVENDDDFEFYRSCVMHVYYEYKLFCYSMEGKQNVKDAYEIIDIDGYESGRVLFFVDKDYDDILGIHQIVASNFFYTNHYSIENYLVTEEVFSIILDRYYVNTINDNLKDKLLKIFRESYNSFVIKIRTFTWFILIDREKSKKAILDNFKLDIFIHLEKMVFYEKKLIPTVRYDNIMQIDERRKKEKNFIRQYSIKDVLSLKCDADPAQFTFANIMDKRELLSTISNHKSFIRGKYDLWFLLEILKTVEKKIEEIYNQNNIIVDQINAIPRRKIEINQLNIFDLVCPKMAYPEDVEIFLTTNYKTLNGNN